MTEHKAHVEWIVDPESGEIQGAMCWCDEKLDHEDLAPYAGL